MSTGDRRRDRRDDQFERKPSRRRYDPPEILDVLPVPDGYDDKQLGELVEQFRFTGRLRWLRYGIGAAMLVSGISLMIVSIFMLLSSFAGHFGEARSWLGAPLWQTDPPDSQRNLPK